MDGYEPKGRTFESCRAHFVFKGISRSEIFGFFAYTSFRTRVAYLSACFFPKNGRLLFRPFLCRLPSLRLLSHLLRSAPLRVFKIRGCFHWNQQHQIPVNSAKAMTREDIALRAPSASMDSGRRLNPLSRATRTP